MADKKASKLLGMIFVIAILLQFSTIHTFTQGNSKNVLIIHAQDQFLPANIVMDKTIYSALKSLPTSNVSIYSEYLEEVRFASKSTQNELIRLLHMKYDKLNLDMIIITDDLSWDFLEENGTELFSGIPVVFCGITAGKLDVKNLGENVTGNFKTVDIKANIETILKVQPDTTEIAVVLGMSNQDKFYETLARKAFDEFRTKVKPEYLIGLSIEDTQKEISKLPLNTVVLYISMYVDGAGRGFNPRDVVPLLKKSSNVPVYGVSDTYLGYGILGGNLLSFADLSQNASEMANEILNGKKPSEILVKVLKNRNYFDWNEMKRWGIKEADLPIGSVIINKNQSVWDLYKWQIISAIIFLIFETLLILLLILQLTLKKKAENNLKNLNETLEQKVIERTAQLEISNKELESFSYSVSHDLRAPLRHMAGFVELLNKHLHEILDDKSRHYIKVISDSANEMGQLIDNLLSFSRMGRTEMINMRVNLDTLIKNVINAFKPETDGRNIELEIGELCDVKGDNNMLQVVFTNIISNALKFTRSKNPAKIEIGSKLYQENTDYIVIYVKDNGAGFDMQFKEKLFGIFQRLHSQKDFEGTGVGLANVQRIILRHGGRVWAEGRLNEGAIFYFTLPKYGGA